MRKKIIIILVFCLVVGAFSIFIPHTQTLSNFIKSNYKEPFGGTTVLNYDFSEEFKPTSEKWRYTDSGKSGYFDECGISSIDIQTGGDNEDLRFVLGDAIGRDVGVYVILNHQPGTEVKLSNTSVITYDFDVDVSLFDISNKIVFQPALRNSNGRVDVPRLAFTNNKFINYSTNEEFICNKSNFHITCMIYERDIYYFVDGVYMTKIQLSSSYSSIDLTRGFWIEVEYKPTSSHNICSFDNFIMNRFAPDYNGAIMRVFDNLYINLKKNSDTVLGGCMDEN